MYAHYRRELSPKGQHFPSTVVFKKNKIPLVLYAYMKDTHFHMNRTNKYTHKYINISTKTVTVGVGVRVNKEKQIWTATHFSAKSAQNISASSQNIITNALRDQ